MNLMQEHILLLLATELSLTMLGTGTALLIITSYAILVKGNSTAGIKLETEATSDLAAFIIRFMQSAQSDASE